MHFLCTALPQARRAAFAAVPKEATAREMTMGLMPRVRSVAIAAAHRSLVPMPLLDNLSSPPVSSG